MDTLLEKVKANLILEHSEDDALLEQYIAAAISYAESYQHIERGFYKENEMPPTTEQAVIMLASHFYESRDGSTGGFFADSTNAALGVDNVSTSVTEDLTGAKIDKNGVLISTSEDGGEPVAIGFRAKKSNGKYRYFWLYRVKFGIPSTSLTTKGESIEFSTPSIEGTVMRRNKVDGEGKHPWKAEVTEGDTGVAASTISGWFSEVYEPDYTAGGSDEQGGTP